MVSVDCKLGKLKLMHWVAASLAFPPAAATPGWRPALTMHAVFLRRFQQSAEPAPDGSGAGKVLSNGPRTMAIAGQQVNGYRIDLELATSTATL